MKDKVAVVTGRRSGTGKTVIGLLFQHGVIVVHADGYKPDTEHPDRDNNSLCADGIGFGALLSKAAEAIRYGMHLPECVGK